jgi:hypothetical protein
VVRPISEGLLQVLLLDVYLLFFKGTHSEEEDECRTAMATIKQITQQLGRSKSENPAQALNFLQIIHKCYANFIEKTQETDFKILHEVNEVAAFTTGDFPEFVTAYNREVQASIVRLFENNLRRPTLQPIRYFVVHNFYDLLKQSLASHPILFEQIVSEFFNTVYLGPHKAIFEPIKSDLLIFFRKNLSVGEVFRRLTEDALLNQPPSFVLEFLNEELPRSPHEAHRLVLHSFLKTASPGFKAQLYGNPILFIMFCLLVHLFECASKALLYTVEDCLRYKGLRHMIRLEQCLVMLAKHVIELNEVAEFHFSPKFKQFVGELMMALNQGEEFKQLMKMLKLMQFVREERREEVPAEQGKLFEEYREYWETRRNSVIPPKLKANT